MQNIKRTKSEDELIREVSSGNKKALAELYQLHFSALYKFVYSRTGSTADSQDIVSETWILVIENLNKFNYQSKFRTFLFGFALNLIRRLYVKEKTVEFDNEIIADEVEEEEVSGKVEQKIKKIKSIMPKLKSNYRQVIEERFFEEKNLKETATSMKTTVQNVKVMQHRAIIKLKELLK